MAQYGSHCHNHQHRGQSYQLPQKRSLHLPHKRIPLYHHTGQSHHLPHMRACPTVTCLINWMNPGSAAMLLGQVMSMPLGQVMSITLGQEKLTFMTVRKQSMKSSCLLGRVPLC